jgi:hypothetical protein
MRVRKQQLKLARGYDDRRRVQRGRISGGEHSSKTVARVGLSRFAGSPLVAIPSFPDTGGWFAGHADSATLLSLGLRLGLGGTHLARTIMLAELGNVLKAAPDPFPDRVNELVMDQNILRKRTGSGRRLSLRHLRELYGLGAPPPIVRAMIRPLGERRQGAASAGVARRLGPRGAVARQCGHHICGAGWRICPRFQIWPPSLGDAIPVATAQRCCVPCRKIVPHLGHNPAT